jgi:hypothetical protein
MLNIVLLITGVYATSIAEESLPPELAQYASTQLENDLSLTVIVFSIVGLIGITANIGIIFLASWARFMFTASIFISTLGMIFAPPIVYTPLEAAVYEVSIVIEGIIIGIMYFTDIRYEFSPKIT